MDSDAGSATAGAIGAGGIASGGGTAVDCSGGLAAQAARSEALASSSEERRVERMGVDLRR